MKACPICGANEGRLRHRIRGFGILACGRCSGWYLREAAADGEAYAGGYLRRASDADGTRGYFDYEAERGLHLRNFARNLEILRQYGAAGALCDVGCASGHFLQGARASGMFDRVAGVDVSAEAIAAVQERLGCAAWAGQVEQMQPPGQFDVVTMWETIEHIERPVEALAALRGWMNPGGLLAVGTGDNASAAARLLGRRWWYLVPPDHCVYFNKVALGMALERAGYRVVGWRRIWMHWVSAANGVMKVLRAFDAKPSVAVGVARRVGAVGVPVWHGSTIVALARLA